MLAGETYGFSSGYDYGMTLKLLFQSMNKKIPLFILTDTKSIFDTLTTSRRLRELRLMNDISEIRRAYRTQEIDNVGWLRPEHNYADPFTRRGRRDMIVDAMKSGRLNIKIEKWIYREDK